MHSSTSSRLCLLLLLACLFPIIASAQYTVEQRAILRDQAEAAARLWERDRSEAELRAALQNLPVRILRGDGRLMELQRFVDGLPVYFITDNAVSAATMSSSRVHPGGGLGYALTGKGVTLSVWDGGKVRTTHQEFGNRVTQMDNTANQADHATHVSGTMIAAGVRPEAKGMSFEAQLLAHDWNNDLAEMTLRAADGIQVSNHSYGTVTGWISNYRGDGRWTWMGNPADNSSEDRNFGLYDSRAREWDQLVFTAPYFLPVKSAGNDRGEGPSSQPVQHWEYVSGAWKLVSTVREKDGGADGYDCVTSYGNAKNILTVGAVEDVPGGYSAPSDVRMSSFSGWGPADDGRIKPDIVANGVGLYSALKSSNSAYASYNGTSMSSPSVSGSIGLILEHQKNLHGAARLRASSIKGLILHTADEAGTAPGPDYTFGWGLMNTARAVKVMTSAAQSAPSSLLREEELRDGSSIEKQIYSPGRGPLKVTICWTDPAGTAQSGGVDPSTRVLVNDLDLRVIDAASGETLPWVLSRVNPSAAATRGDNIVDNIEQVYIPAPEEGMYTIRITHKGALSGGRQYVSIIASVGNEVALLSPPNGLTSSSVTPALMWNTAKGALSYELQVSETADFKTPVVNATGLAQAWYDTPALKKFATYYWRVRVRDQQGLSDWSDVWSFVTGGTPAQAGHALEFDGEDDRVVLQHTPELATVEQLDAITIEAWVKVQGWVNGGFALVDKHDAQNDNGWSLRLRSGGAVEFNPSSAITCAAGLPTGTWAHVAVSWSKQSGKVRTYVNGVRRCESDYTGELRATGSVPLYVGFSPSGIDMASDGQIDELRIWNAVRSEVDINAGMFTSYSGGEAGLVAQFRFDDARALNASVQPGASQATLERGPAWVVSSVPMMRPPAPVPVYPLEGSSNIPISLTAVWQPATSALRYRVQLARDPGFASPLLDARDLTVLTQAFPLLLPETDYYWRVNASNAIGTSDWSATQHFVTAVAPPEAPKLVVPRDAAVNQPLVLSVLWEAPARAQRYHVQVSTDSLFEGAFLIDREDVISPSIDVPDLGNNQKCYWRVRAINLGGSSPWSTMWRFTTIPAEPDAPLLIAPAADARGVSVNPAFTWQPAEAATSYAMQLSTDPQFASTIINASGIPFTQYAATGLERGVWHYWRVRGMNAAGAGEWSETRGFITERDAPAAVVLSAPADGSTSIPLGQELRWLTAEHADDYEVHVSEVPDFSTMVLSKSGITTTSYTPSDEFSAERRLYWRVRARNERGEGPWSAVWSFTTAAAPLRAPVLRSPADGSTAYPIQLPFVWESVSGADRYDVEIAVDTLAAASESATQSSVLRDLEEERMYHWRVRAWRGGEEGPWSARWTFATTLRLPDAVTLLAPTAGAVLASDTVQFSWTASQPQVTRYWLEHSFDAAFSGQRTIDSAIVGTAVSMRVYSQGETCYWRVRAGNSAGWGPFSAASSFQPIVLSTEAGAARMRGSFELTLHPNPTRYGVEVRCEATPLAVLRVELRDVLGRTLAVLHDGRHQGGALRLVYTAELLRAGRYYVVMHGDGRSVVRPLTVVR